MSDSEIGVHIEPGTLVSYSWKKSNILGSLVGMVIKSYDKKYHPLQKKRVWQAAILAGDGNIHYVPTKLLDVV